MGLETLTFERFMCDRCGTTENIPCGVGLDRRALWAWSEAQFYQAGQLFYGHYKLCPECAKSLRNWSHPKFPAEVVAENNG